METFGWNEAIKRMLLGKAVRSCYWLKRVYWYLKNAKVYEHNPYNYGSNEDLEVSFSLITINSILCDMWMEEENFQGIDCQKWDSKNKNKLLEEIRDAVGQVINEGSDIDDEIDNKIKDCINDCEKELEEASMNVLAHIEDCKETIFDSFGNYWTDKLTEKIVDRVLTLLKKEIS